MNECNKLGSSSKRGRRPLSLIKNPMKSSITSIVKKSTGIKSRNHKQFRATLSSPLLFPSTLLKSDDDSIMNHTYPNPDAPISCAHGFYYKYWRPVITSDSQPGTLEVSNSISTNSISTQTTPLGTGLYWPIPPFVSTKPFTAQPVSPTKGTAGNTAIKKNFSANISGPTEPEVWSVIFKRLTELALDRSSTQILRAVLTCARVCKSWYETILKPGREGNWVRMRISSLCAPSNPFTSQATSLLISSSIMAFVARCQPFDLDLNGINPSHSTLCYLLRWLPNLRRLNVSRASGDACILPAFLNAHPAPLWLESIDLSWCSNLNAIALAKLITPRPICHRPGFASGAPKFLSPPDRKSQGCKRDAKSEKNTEKQSLVSCDIGGGNNSSYLPFKNLQHLSISGTDVFLHHASLSSLDNPDCHLLTLDFPWDMVDKKLTPHDKLSLAIGYLMYSNLPNLTDLEVDYSRGINHHFLIGLSGRLSESVQPKKRSKIEKLSLVGVPKIHSENLNRHLANKYFPNLKAGCE